ncbi:DUF2946 family protein [Aquabacterium sp.]|uniref:DUF2946 family protein n=1 Tax=Aquabacterium sp. TaxID=1872578 RepID=UPI0035B0CFD6
MLLWRAHRWWMVWVASAAILLHAVVPVLAQAAVVRSLQAPGLGAVCSAHRSAGTHQAGGESAPRSSVPDQPHPVKNLAKAAHCASCTSHVSPLVLPAVAQPLVLDSPARGPLPRLFYLAPRPLFAWTQARPRAPPLA